MAIKDAAKLWQADRLRERQRSVWQGVDKFKKARSVGNRHVQFISFRYGLLTGLHKAFAFRNCCRDFLLKLLVFFVCHRVTFPSDHLT